MNRYYYSVPYRASSERFVGPLIPFFGGLLLGSLFIPGPNLNQQVPPPYPPYYPSYVPGPYVPYSNTINNQEIPTYYSSMNNENINIYPYSSPRY